MKLKIVRLLMLAVFSAMAVLLALAYGIKSEVLPERPWTQVLGIGCAIYVWGAVGICALVLWKEPLTKPAEPLTRVKKCAFVGYAIGVALLLTSMSGTFLSATEVVVGKEYVQFNAVLLLTSLLVFLVSSFFLGSIAKPESTATTALLDSWLGPPKNRPLED